MTESLEESQFRGPEAGLPTRNAHVLLGYHSMGTASDEGMSTSTPTTPESQQNKFIKLDLAPNKDLC